MNLIKIRTLPFCIAFIFLCVPFSIKAQQGAFSVVNYYLEKQDYANAALECERIVFSDTSLTIANEALFLKVDCYKSLGEYEKAAKTLERMALFGLSASQHSDYFYEKILCNYLAARFTEASLAIEEMEFSKHLQADTNRTLLIQVLTYNELKEWKKAEQKAYSWAETFLEEPLRDSIRHLIEHLYRTSPVLKKESTLKFLSLVPGMGHLYLGYWGEGLVSFSINASILAFGVYQAWHSYYITAYLGGAGLLSATYLGSRERAQFLFNKSNYQKTRSFNEKVKQQLLTF